MSLGLSDSINAAAASFVVAGAAAGIAGGPLSVPGADFVVADIPFNFGPEYETKVVAMLLREDAFLKEASAYLKPEFFTSAVERNVVAVLLDFVRRYAAMPEITTVLEHIQKSKDVIQSEWPIYVQKLVGLSKLDLRERTYVREKVVEFCRSQALLRLAASMPDLLQKGELDKIKSNFGRATAIGQVTQAQKIDYLTQSRLRQVRRENVSKGLIKTGVSTGFDELDAHLYHNGWGLGEVTVPMAAAKRGKTALCLQSAAFSAIKKNVRSLYVSLEVGQIIMEDRLDACLSNTNLTSLITDRDAVASEMEKLAAMSQGKIWLEARAANTLTTNDLDLLIESYFNDGKPIDVVFVDYLGIIRLTPADDRFIGLGNATKELRRIAGKYNIAIVAPHQTNRDGAGKALAGMGDISESFAIAQDCDLLLSINGDQQELAAGVRRIYFAASRNQAEVTIKVKGDLAKMRLIEQVIGVEH